MTDTVVELIGVNGETFNLTTGDQGIYLATDPQGLYDPEVKVVYEEPGNWPGARYLNHRILRRDIVFGAEILNDAHLGGSNSWLRRDSVWRKAWAFDRDCILKITTPESGTRSLRLRLGAKIEIEMVTDPNGRLINLAKMTCIAGDPFWYGEDLVKSATTLTDTTYNYVSPPTTLPSETLTITVDATDGGLNPTDQYVFMKWTVPASTEAPSAPYIPGIPWLGGPTSPQTTWTLPDYSFEDATLANRRLRLPGLIGGLHIQTTGQILPGENCVIDTDPRVEQVSAENEAPVWERMNGVRFRHPVPPWTEAKTFEITVSGAIAGQMVTLRIPRPWSRPWGLE